MSHADHTRFVYQDEPSPPGAILRVQRADIRGAVVLDGRRPSLSYRNYGTRPLTSEEMGAVRTVVDSSRPREFAPLCAVLALAGGSSGEIAKVRPGHIDLEEATVTFCGSEFRNRPLYARSNPLDEWSVAVIQRCIHSRSPIGNDDRLCVRPATPTTRADSTVGQSILSVLQRAEVAGRPGVLSTSLRKGAGLQVLESDGIEAAARFLGYHRLDITAEVLGHDWM